MVFEHQGTHVVAVSTRVATGMSPRRDAAGKLTIDLIRSFGPYRRLFTGRESIASLEASADPDENVTISYTEQGEREHVVKLDSKSRVISNQ
jgi:hypothetical protein